MMHDHRMEGCICFYTDPVQVAITISLISSVAEKFDDLATALDRIEY